MNNIYRQPWRKPRPMRFELVSAEWARLYGASPFRRWMERLRDHEAARRAKFGQRK